MFFCLCLYLGEYKLDHILLLSPSHKFFVFFFLNLLICEIQKLWESLFKIAYKDKLENHYRDITALT